MWTNANRARYDRGALRYPSDLTDAERAHVAPVIPTAKRGGNKRTEEVRDGVNGLQYTTACVPPHQLRESMASELRSYTWPAIARLPRRSRRKALRFSALRRLAYLLCLGPLGAHGPHGHSDARKPTPPYSEMPVSTGLLVSTQCDTRRLQPILLCAAL